MITRGMHVDAPAVDQAILLHGRDFKPASRHVTSDQVAPRVYGFRNGCAAFQLPREGLLTHLLGAPVKLTVALKTHLLSNTAVPPLHVVLLNSALDMLSSRFSSSSSFHCSIFALWEELSTPQNLAGRHAVTLCCARTSRTRLAGQMGTQR